MPESALASIGHQHAVAQLLAEHRDARVLDPRTLCYPADIARARSRVVMQARLAGNVTHILWLDSDVVPKRGFLGAMLETGHDWIGCPYPRKRIHWERVRPTDDEQPEHLAYDYAYHPQRLDSLIERPHLAVNGGCVAVERLSIGCTLTSMRALNAMWDYFRDADWYTDVVDGKHYDGVALFGLLFSHTASVRGKPFRALYSEDYSACERYNVMRENHPERGFGPCQMLITHPADHAGGHLFRGHPFGTIYRPG